MTFCKGASFFAKYGGSPIGNQGEVERNRERIVGKAPDDDRDGRQDAGCRKELSGRRPRYVYLGGTGLIISVVVTSEGWSNRQVAEIRASSVHARLRRRMQEVYLRVAVLGMV